MDLIKLVSTEQDWAVFRVATDFEKDYTAAYKHSLFWMQIGKMVTRVTNRDTNKDIIGNPTDDFPANDDIMSQITTLCVVVGVNILSLVAMIMLGVGSHIIHAFFAVSSFLTSYFSQFLVRNIPLAGNVIARGAVAANEMIIAGNGAVYEAVMGFDVGVAVIEGFWVAGPVISLEMILRYFLQMQIRLFNRVTISRGACNL